MTPNRNERLTVLRFAELCSVSAGRKKKKGKKKLLKGVLIVLTRSECTHREFREKCFQSGDEEV